MTDHNDAIERALDQIEGSAITGEYDLEWHRDTAATILRDLVAEVRNATLAEVDAVIDKHTPAIDAVEDRLARIVERCKKQAEPFDDWTRGAQFERRRILAIAREGD